MENNASYQNGVTLNYAYNYYYAQAIDQNSFWDGFKLSKIVDNNKTWLKN